MTHFHYKISLSLCYLPLTWNAGGSHKGISTLATIKPQSQEELAMTTIKPTPEPWLIKRWDNEMCVDGFETAITDSRGHGIAVFTQKGKSKKVDANARVMAHAPAMLRLLKEINKISGRLHHGTDNLETIQKTNRLIREIHKTLLQIEL